MTRRRIRPAIDAADLILGASKAPDGPLVYLGALAGKARKDKHIAQIWQIITALERMAEASYMRTLRKSLGYDD